MFTGLIETTARVIRHSPSKTIAATELELIVPDWFRAVSGDSIAVNGCCLTLVKQNENHQMIFDLSRETLECTSLAALTTDSVVNLERAMSAQGRFGGHFVSGHVDGLATIDTYEKHPGGWFLRVCIPSELARFVAKKGSICLDGISLTINEVTDYQDATTLELQIIPTTHEKTNLSQLAAGMKMNVEVDLIARYLDRLRISPS